MAYPVLPDAKLNLVDDRFAFTEGPAADYEGNVYFTDQPNDRIWKVDIEGDLSLFMEPAGRANGLFFTRNGDLLACADEKNELWSIDQLGNVTKLVSDYDQTLLNGPNDVWAAPNGIIYFTDPYYERAYWRREKEPLQQHEALYRLAESGEVLRLDSSFQRPNGIVGTPDGKYLFVADIGANKTYRYVIAPDGMLEKKTLFVEQGSDGMTLDNDGNLYLTGDGVTVYNQDGEKICHIDVPAKWTANVCFGGKEKRTLFITASEKLFTLQMQVEGVNYSF